MTAEDELKIFQNILAQSPDGLSDPQLIGKFAKAKAQLHAMDSMTAMQSQMMPTSPVQPLAGGTISPTAGQSTAQDLNAPLSTPNQPIEQPIQNG